MKKALSKNKVSSGTTKLFLPAWWIDSYDSVASKIEPSHYLTLVERLKIIPLFDANELSSMALISARVQECLLEGDGITRINASFLGKHISTGKNDQIHSKVLQLVGGIRYIDDGATTSIVDSEKIYVDECNEDPEIELRLTDEGDELVLGVVDAFKECSRKLKGNFHVNKILNNKPPIGVAKSLWLDLNHVESALLLRMETAMHWDHKWLHFNGTFGQDLLSIFSGLSIKLRKDVPNEFSKKLKVLDKFGKKLIEHGLVMQLEPKNYLAFEASTDIQLVWKLASESNQWEDENKYFEKCCRYFSKRNFELSASHIPFLLKELFQESLGEHIGELDQFRSSLEDREVDADGLLTILNGNCVLSKFDFFCELYLRKHSQGTFLISEELAAHFTLISGDLDQSWENYLLELNAISGRIEDIVNEHSILGSKFFENLSPDLKARLSKGLTKWNEQSRDSQNAISSVKHDKDKVETRARNDRNKPGKTKENELTTHGLGSKFRKLASQELERLKRHQPSEYLKIQQKYFDSMTEKQRKTWNEVTSRVRPELRDQQLKLMLIRFMVNNPNLWASEASASSSEKK